jgi:hypothetical protein
LGWETSPNPKFINVSYTQKIILYNILNHFVHEMKVSWYGISYLERHVRAQKV